MLPSLFAALTGAVAIVIAFLVKNYFKLLELTGSQNSLRSAPRTVQEFEKLAHTCVPEIYWKYYSSGAGQGYTLKDNVAAFDRYLIRPRYLKDVSIVDMSVTLFGDEVELPIGTSPTAFYSPACRKGELSIAKACEDLGACMILSAFSSAELKEVVKTFRGRGTVWYNLLVGTSDDICREQVTLAEQAGIKAIVLTIDMPVGGSNKSTVFEAVAKDTKFVNFNFSKFTPLDEIRAHFKNPSTTWDKIDTIRRFTRLPIILKGILTAEDAAEAIKHGIQGIIISNHGGRQLDGVPATIDVLDEVVSAVEKNVDVFVDGGIRKGTDVLKSLALGAKMVFVGRPVIWGMEYNGFEGVKDVLTILRDEFKVAMQLSGCANLSEIKKNNIVVHESHYRCCHVNRNVVNK